MATRVVYICFPVYPAFPIASIRFSLGAYRGFLRALARAGRDNMILDAGRLGGFVPGETVLQVILIGQGAATVRLLLCVFLCLFIGRDTWLWLVGIVPATTGFVEDVPIDSRTVSHLDDMLTPLGRGRGVDRL